MKCEPKYEAAGFLEFEATHVAAEMLLDPSLAPIPTTLLYAGIANLVYETTCLSYFFFGFAHANFDSYRPRHTSEAVSKLVKNLDYVSVVPVPGIRHMVCQVLHRGTYASLRL